MYDALFFPLPDIFRDYFLEITKQNVDRPFMSVCTGLGNYFASHVIRHLIMVIKFSESKHGDWFGLVQSNDMCIHVPVMQTYTDRPHPHPRQCVFYN